MACDHQHVHAYYHSRDHTRNNNSRCRWNQTLKFMLTKVRRTITTPIRPNLGTTCNGTTQDGMGSWNSATILLASRTTHCRHLNSNTRNLRPLRNHARSLRSSSRSMSAWTSRRTSAASSHVLSPLSRLRMPKTLCLATTKTQSSTPTRRPTTTLLQIHHSLGRYPRKACLTESLSPMHLRHAPHDADAALHSKDKQQLCCGVDLKLCC